MMVKIKQSAAIHIDDSDQGNSAATGMSNAIASRSVGCCNQARYYVLKNDTYRLVGSLDQTVPFKFFERKQLFFLTNSQTRAEDMM